MKTTTIGGLTIHRLAPGEDPPSRLSATGAPGRLFVSGGPAPAPDEHYLALVECMGLHDDERTEQVARSADTIVVFGGGELPPWWGGEEPLMAPAAACVAKKERSIGARQAAIEAGVVPADTPLVGVPIPGRTRVGAPQAV